MKSIPKFFKSVRQSASEIVNYILEKYSNGIGMIKNMFSSFSDLMLQDSTTDIAKKPIKAIEKFRQNKLVFKLNIFIGITALIILLTSLKSNPQLSIGAYVLIGILVFQYVFPGLLATAVLLITIALAIAASIALFVFAIIAGVIGLLANGVLQVLTYPIAFLITIVGYPTLFLLDITGIKKQGN